MKKCTGKFTDNKAYFTLLTMQEKCEIIIKVVNLYVLTFSTEADCTKSK